MITGLCMSWATLLAFQDAPPSPATPPVPPAAAAQPTADERERIDAILTAVEKSGEALRSVRCRVEYREEDQLNLVETRRRGQVTFLKTDANPLFLIEFDETVADEIPSTQRLWYLFNGSSLIEAREKSRHVVERQVVAPGEKVDFFDLESAPFPMPFGQKKAPILKNFDVTLGPAKSDGGAEVDHLICVPKPDSRMVRRYQRLEFFVLKDLALPRRIVATLSGDRGITEALFPDLKREALNAKVDMKDFQEPADWKSYTRDVEPYEE